MPELNEMLRMLDSLKASVRDFAGREEKINHDHRLRIAAEKKSFDAASETASAEAAEAIERQEEIFKSETQRHLARFEKRKANINRAHINARSRVMDGIADEEGRSKYRVQEGTIAAEKRRESEKARAAGVLEEFNHRGIETRDAFVALEQKARRKFGGFGSFQKLLAYDRAWPEPDTAGDENRLHDESERLRASTEKELQHYPALPQLFRFLPLWLWGIVLGGFAAAVPAMHRLGYRQFSIEQAGVAAGAFVLVLVVYLIAKSRASARARTIAGNIARARRLLDAGFEKAESRFIETQQRLNREYDETIESLNAQWRKSVKAAIELRGTRPTHVDSKAQRINQKNEEIHRRSTQERERRHKDAQLNARSLAQARARELASGHAAKVNKINADHNAHWADLEAEWRKTIQPVHDAIRAANDAADAMFPPWEIPLWADWTPPDSFLNAAKFGRINVDLEKFAESIPKDPRLSFPGPTRFSVPLTLTYPRNGSILIEAKQTGHETAISAINNIIYRLLSMTPPGKLNFTIFDPVGLGQNFAGMMHLADYEESHINSRIWTQQNQFEERLGELNEHMEKVIQMYLRNEYATIAEYNAHAGTIAEKYHILVIASFPANFSDTAARRLRNIATSGARCGVYTLIHWDQRLGLPPEFVPDEMRANSVDLTRWENGFALADWRHPGTQLVLDPPPSAEFATHFLHQVGQSGKDANRVEVPFEQVAPSQPEVWSLETTEELTVPIGRSGATKFQYLEIGKGTRQHALIAGKTGSGKSTLFHVIITNLSLWCSPEQVEFYLVDFKKGVEFKCYASRRLPHARVVAIESDREFGLSVLHRVDAELRRRGDLFRALGVQDVAGYKRAGGTEPMPRSLLMIDEFQEFFTEEDRVSQGAAVLLDRIVRQGRAFGIHVILGSQTLGGAYTLARATLGQMVIRIALQCNEADAYLIMDQDNPAPRLLSRPGEGIYNDSAGAIEGNSPFQAVWLSEDVRDQFLSSIRDRADHSDRDYPGPFVFEGNAPADVRENPVLNGVLKTAPAAIPAQSRIWIGAPNSIKGPTEAVFLRQSGNNLLVVGQNDEASLTLVAVALVSLAAQYPVGSARFVLLDSTVPESAERDFLDRTITAVPHDLMRIKSGDISAAMSLLADEMKARGERPDADYPEIFVLVCGLQNYKKLRQEDEFSFSSADANSPASILLNVINEGSAVGIHVIVTCDSYTNLNRFLGRKNLTGFEMRVLFQMSASDSASLIDSPEAATLGLHRALYYNDREGYTETFRPYSRPANEWIDGVSRQLKRSLAGR